MSSSLITALHILRSLPLAEIDCHNLDKKMLGCSMFAMNGMIQWEQLCMVQGGKGKLCGPN